MTWLRPRRAQWGGPGHDRQWLAVASRLDGSGRRLSCSMPAAEAGPTGDGVGDDHVEGHGPVVGQARGSGFDPDAGVGRSGRFHRDGRGSGGTAKDPVRCHGKSRDPDAGTWDGADTADTSCARDGLVPRWCARIQSKNPRTCRTQRTAGGRPRAGLKRPPPRSWTPGSEVLSRTLRQWVTVGGESRER